MGDTWYIARPDNGTLFDFDREFSFDIATGRWVAFSDYLTTGRRDPIVLGEIYPALVRWFGEDDRDHAQAVAEAVSAFAEGMPVYFISEHDEQLEGDKYRRQKGGLLNVVAYRHRVHQYNSLILVRLHVNPTIVLRMNSTRTAMSQSISATTWLCALGRAWLGMMWCEVEIRKIRDRKGGPRGV